MKYLLILSCLLFTSVGWSQEYGEQQQFMTDLIRETIRKNESAINTASVTRNWIKASKKLCEIGGIFDAYGLKKDWYGYVREIDMEDDGDVFLEISIGNTNSVRDFTLEESLIDTVLDMRIGSKVKFSGYFKKGNISENECLRAGSLSSPDMIDEPFLFEFTDVVFQPRTSQKVVRKCEDEKYLRKFNILKCYGNGNIKLSGNKIDGKLEGEYLEYYENGQLMTKWNFKNGKLEGEWLFYNKNGQLKKTEIYKNGEKID